MNLSTNDTFFPLDSKDETIDNSANYEGSFVSIQDQFNGFTVEQYVEKYWSFEIGKVDREFFWEKYPDKFHNGEIDDGKTWYAAEEILLNHMLESYADKPKAIAQFFNIMLFDKLKYTGERVRDLDMEDSQRHALDHLYVKRRDMYQDYFRLSFYQVLEDDSLGSKMSKDYAIAVLSIYEKEPQVYPLLKRLAGHESMFIRLGAKAGLNCLDEKHPDFSPFKL